MTEKRLFVGKKTVEDRFTIILDYDGEIGVRENRSGDVVVLKHRDLNSEQFVGQLVLFLNDQNEAICQSFEKMDYWSDKAVERIKELEKENEQLKKKNEIAIDGLTLCQEKNADLELRNNRQASTIDNLYSLIENKDWDSLTAIITEIQEAEEQLKEEERLYCCDNND